jgi:preprotein translocase SecF subunit
VGKDSISAEKQEELTKALEEKFADNEISLYNSNSVSPTIAGTFFAKSLVAVLITALLVVIYVGIRFKRIGGVSAALTALCALVFDLFTTLCICVFFKLQIDSNYIAVVLTILGYSLNDTIVMYDRVRENERLEPDMEIGELVNKSINMVKMRNFVTSLTTFIAVITIVVVSELFGLSTLRSFAIPMAFGIVSGGVSSLFIAGPIWVIWKRHKANKLAASSKR